MSTWIYVTNLPLYYDEIALKDIFYGIGEIITTKISKDKLILKSTAIIQFTHSKHAKLASSKKDGIVIDKSAIKVFIIWCNKEDLSTIKVSNILSTSTIRDLEKHFTPYGDIVNIEIINHKYALISYCKIDYALQATQAMNDNIIDSDNKLCVALVNSDARNLQWKRHTFEYIALNGKPKRHIKNDENDENMCDEYNKLMIYNELIVYGYIRCNINTLKSNNIAIDLLCFICNIGLCYYGIYNHKPLYLLHSSIPPPPQRLPPLPPDDNSSSELQCTETDSTDTEVTDADEIIIIEEELCEGKDGIIVNNIEGKYQQIFDIYRDRLDLIENRMSNLSTDLDNISVTMNRTLVGLENRRINDINTIQKQFNSTITALCYQINNQINNQIIKITQKMEQCRNTNIERIDTLENKIQILKKENNILRKQSKINKILKIKQTNNSNSNSSSNNSTEPQQQLVITCTEEEKLKNWLFDIVKLPQYLSILIKNGYDDLETIFDVTFDELQQIGINKMGHRKKIIKYAQKINQNSIKNNHINTNNMNKPSAMSPNSANSSLLYTSHNIWSDDSVSSMPWNTYSQGSNNNNKTQID